VRPDVPARVANAVERALAKEPDHRFASMDAFVDELVACRNELPAPDSAQTMILTEQQPRPAAAAPAVATKARRRSRLVVPLLVVLLLAAAGIGAYLLWRHQNASPTLGGRPAQAASVDVKAVAAYDPPPGDGVERNDLLGSATDGSASTYWQTEHYTTAQFGNLKRGVGLVLDAGKNVKLGSLTIETATPGFSALIKDGSSPRGPFDTLVSAEQTVGGKTTFTLHVPTTQRYYVVWITRLTQFDTGDPSKPFGAQIAEVTAG
jgi:hypothetical protein